MSVRAISQVWDRSEASGTTLLVLLALADHATDKGVCFPYIESLAAKGRCDEKTVRRSIRWLQDEHEIDIWEWYDKKSKRKRNAYRVTVGDLSAFRGIEPEEIAERATVLRVNVPTALRRQVFERDGWTCVKCGSKTDLVIDHETPVTEGGGNEIENLRTLCAPCNTTKAAKTGPNVESRPGEMSARKVEPDRTQVPTHDRAQMSGPTRGRSSSGPSGGPSGPLVPSVLAVPVGVPELTMVDDRNLPFEALSEVCGVDPHGNRGGELGVALYGGKSVRVGIRELVWRDVVGYATARDGTTPTVRAGEDFERLVANEIRNKSRLWEQKFGRDVTMTPTALAKWWTDLPGLADRTRSKSDQRADTLAWLDEIIAGGES